MKKVYKEIQRINKLDPATPTLRLCKLFEEAGEFAQAVNKKLGRKVVNETEQEVLDLIKEEAADTIQCLLSFADSYDLGYSHFKDEFRDGSHRPDGTKPEVILAKIFKYVGGIVYRFEKNHPELEFQFNTCISKVLTLASYYGIKESEVVAKIAEKNIKWEKVVNKRIEDGKAG
jgi:NTP pyrophosphatase (non-canonical NTP hydrolase)